MAAPTATVDIAFDSGYLTPAASRTWTDVSAYVEADAGISIQRGRPDQFSTPQPSKLSLTLDNRDGRFTPEYTSGAYYPNVKKGRPIRVKVGGGTVTETFATSANVTLGAGSTVGSGVLSSTGTSYWWFNTSDWVTPGDFVFACDVNLTGAARNLCNIAFWMTDTTSSATYDGYFLRLDTLVSQSGFYQFTDGTHGGLLGATGAGMPTGTPMRVTLTGTASSGQVVASVVNISTSAVLFSQTLTLPAGNRSGTFGQKHDGAGTGHTIDNASLTTTGSTRFVGYIDEWPVQWPGDSDAMSTVTISATSRQARLGRAAAFKSIVEEEYLYDGPVLYWPLGEPSGSTTAGNIAPGRTGVLTVTQVGTGGTLEFGAGIGPVTDGLTAAVFTPVDQVNGKCLSAALTSFLPDSGYVAMEAWVSCATPLAYPQSVMSLESTDGPRRAFGFLIDLAGKGAFGAAGVVSPILTAASICDGAVHHLVGIYSSVLGTLTLTFYMDGALVGTSVTGHDPPGEVTRVVVGGATAVDSGVTNLLAGSVSHAVVYSSSIPTSTRFAQHYTAGLNGYSGEASGARIARYARLAGIPTAEISVETGLSTSIAHKDTTGETPIGLMQDVATTEDGVVFDGKDGTLTFHSRSHRYNVASAFTLSVAAGDVQGGLTPTLDDQHLTNDMTASRPNGVTIRSTNPASITEYGTYKESVEILTTSDAEVQSRADWEVNRFGTPRVTVPNLAVDLATCSSGLIASLLAADVGTRFTVTGLPSQAPASSMDFFIEGIAERIGVGSYGIEFNVSPTAYATVWQLDSATLSQLDSTTVLAY